MIRLGESAVTERRSIISVVTDNEPGVLARIAGMLSGRGYNIDSLTVAPIDTERARFTILVSASEAVIGQIIAQLERLVPVHTARAMENEGLVARELALVKFDPRAIRDLSFADIADLEGVRTLRQLDDQAVFELTGTTQQIDGFLARLTARTEVEIVRTGTAAMAALHNPDAAKLREKGAA
jgi:acetolactate synthase I/III small subunit